MGWVKHQITKAMRTAHRNCYSFLTTIPPRISGEQVSSHQCLNKHSACTHVCNQHLRFPLLSANREVFWWSFGQENDSGAMILVHTSEARNISFLLGKECILFKPSSRTDIDKCLWLLCTDSSLSSLPSPRASLASQWKRNIVFLNPATRET